jgi:hypothetical protein
MANIKGDSDQRCDACRFHRGLAKRKSSKNTLVQPNVERALVVEVWLLDSICGLGFVPDLLGTVRRTHQLL